MGAQGELTGRPAEIVLLPWVHEGALDRVSVLVSQLRVYTIKPGKMEEWIRGWTEGVYPLRLKHGFRVDGAWVLHEEDKFVWILSYEGPEDWETKNAKYYASADRTGLDPDPAQHIAKAEQWIVTPVLPMPF